MKIDMEEMNKQQNCKLKILTKTILNDIFVFYKPIIA